MVAGRNVAVINDALEMRVVIAKNKPPRGALDVKLVLGGLVDLEFAVHVSQLPTTSAFMRSWRRLSGRWPRPA